LIEHSRSTISEAEAIIDAIDTYNRYREAPLSAPSEQQPAPLLGLDIGVDERPAPKTDEELTVKLNCQICYTQIADTAVLPCGHLAMCGWCADQACPVREGEDRTRVKGLVNCPCCRKKVKKRVSIPPRHSSISMLILRRSKSILCDATPKLDDD